MASRVLDLATGANEPDTRRSPWRLVAVGVRYCLNHNGVANEDDDRCDFGRHDGGACNFRELYRKERRP